MQQCNIQQHTTVTKTERFIYLIKILNTKDKTKQQNKKKFN